MDKLKQNAYWIAVGGTGVVLIVLAYFLVWAPLGDLGLAQESLQSLGEKIERTAKREYVQTKDYLKYLEEKRQAAQEAVEKGTAHYDQAGKAFDLFFDDVELPPQPGDFSARYKDELEKMIHAYQEKFGIKPDETNPDATLPRVSRLIDGLDESKVPIAMKEFWFIQEVFDALNRLELGGLKQIDFPGRLTEAKEVLPFNKWMSGTVQIEMPFAKLENFLSELYASKRVPFQLEELSFRKTTESLGKHASLDHGKQFVEASETIKADYKQEIPDPPVLVDLKLLAFDWTGAPPIVEEKEAAPADDGGKAGKTGKQGKAGKGPKPK